MKMLPLMENNKRIINVDESWLNHTHFLRKIWAPVDSNCTFTDKQVAPRISLILAHDTDGRMWFALTQANTDTDIMTTFLRYMVQRLDQETPGWQENSVILLDNAKWHSNQQMKLRLNRMNLPIIYSAPYCYSTAPVELVFAALKFGDLNPHHLPTGKKSLSHLAAMVNNRLASIPRSVAIKYWHHVVLHHFGQLCLERI